MGYTHYWTQKRDFTNPEWETIRAIVPITINQAKSCGIVIKGADGTGKPIINGECISLNGDSENGNDHETFYLKRQVRITKQQPEESFDFCKTAQKPYDAVVVTILAAVKEFCPGVLELSSDGGDDVFVDQFKRVTVLRKKTDPKKDAQKALVAAAKNFLTNNGVTNRAALRKAILAVELLDAEGPIDE